MACLVAALLAGLAATAAAQLSSEIVIDGLRNPVAIVPDPTHPATFFIVEQRGLVRVARDGQLLDEPFLDLRDEVSTGGERGLLGLTLAPDYAESRRLFVNFTNRDGHTVIARFTRSEQSGVRAEVRSRFDLLWPGGRRTIAQPFSNHNGGHLAFGPDGLLYVGLGDGGSGGDPMNHAQRADSLLGKMLRLDVGVGDDDTRGYRIPDDNPFVDGEPIRALEEIWAFGLRNPWRYSFDDWTRGGTSALVIADVGQNAREEISFEPAGRGGRNYGWRLREGRQPYDERTPAAFLPLTEPIHDYGRDIGASITGGVIYRGAALDPAYEGRYFYADFISGRIFSLGLHLDDAGEAQAADEREHTAALGGRTRLGMISSFAQDHRGELLLLNYMAGTVIRITPDLSVVPAAPEALQISSDGAHVRLAWTMPASAVDADLFVVEGLRGGRVEQRIESTRREMTLLAAPDTCFRVRARARNGASGPASTLQCVTEP
jgi:glucose/arabinose dehydrogenase